MLAYAVLGVIGYLIWLAITRKRDISFRLGIFGALLQLEAKGDSHRKNRESKERSSQ